MDNKSAPSFWFSEQEIVLVKHYLNRFFEVVELPLREGRQPLLNELPDLSPEIADRLLAYIQIRAQEGSRPRAPKD